MPSLFAAMVNREDDERVRCHALTGLVDLRLKIDQANQNTLMNTLMELTSTDSSVLVQLRAARGLGFSMSPQRQLSVIKLWNVWQQDDKWLAWLAYKTVHHPHRQMKMSFIGEKESLERHKKFAPPFPGYRTKLEVSP